jgi:serine/threonine protein kinase
VNIDGREGDDDRAGGPPRVLGRYRVVAELGRGSTSIVYLGAVDGPGGFSKLFALKLLRPALAEDPAMVSLFVAEARIGAQLNHPNVVSTLEIEEGAALPFIVMEFLDGKPLQDVVTTARIAFTPLPLHMHLAALSGALEGLGHAHAAVGPGGAALRIVHCDVSPHNVFVTTSGMPKVLDFGFAQSADSPNPMLTSAARVAYMSPEQADGALVDPRSDLFSVGVMMWEAVTRRRFWSEEATKADILRALRARELPYNRISALAKTSEEIRSLVARATEPDPAARYETAAEFQSDLRAVLNQITPSTFALRELGQRVVTLFASDRARLQRAIEEHHITAEAVSSGRRSTWPTRSEPPGAGTSRTTARSESSRPPSVIPRTDPPPPVTPRSPLPPAATPSSPFPPMATPRSPPPPRATPRSPLPPAVVPQFEAQPVVEAAASEPLPSYRSSSFEGAGRSSSFEAAGRGSSFETAGGVSTGAKGGWRPNRQTLAAGTLALAIVVGVALSALHGGHGDTEPHVAAAAVGPSAETTAVHPSIEPSSTAANTGVLAPTEPTPARTTTEAAETAPAEEIATPPAKGHPRPALASSGPHPGRVERLGDGATSVPAAMSPRAPAPAPVDEAVRGADVAGPSPIHVTDTNPPGARPPHPIDSANPYGP